ncbi:MAG: FtsX-like permease family protein [Deinococcales bacterium]
MLLLAWRNIWRKMGRSLSTAGAVAVVVLITLSFFALTGAARNGIYYSATRLAGHLQIHKASYKDSRRLRDISIHDNSLVQRLETSLSEAGLRADIVSVLAVPVLIESEGRSYGVLLQGLAQSPEASERYAKEYLLKGRLPLEHDDPDILYEIALGEKLARNLKVDLGDTLYLYAPDSEGYGAAAFELVGILKLPNSDKLSVSPLLAAQDLAAPEAITQVEITLLELNRERDDAHLPTIVERLKKSLGDDLLLETWAQVNPDLASFVSYFKRIAFVISAIFFVLAGLLVANTVYLSVMERVREFGVLRALGAKQRTVVASVLLESCLLCLVGAMVGLVLGLGVVSVLSAGFSFPKEVADFLTEQGFPQKLYGNVSLREIAITLIFTVLTALIAALLPALTAGRLEPVEAMRFTA